MRTAHPLAYLAQLLLMSLPDVKQEFAFRYKFEQWTNMLDRAVLLSPPPPEPELAAAADMDTQSTNLGTTSYGIWELSSFRMQFQKRVLVSALKCVVTKKGRGEGCYG